MSPILGIWASAKPGAPATSFESIATTTLSTSQSSVTFSSIPSDYTHLQVRILTRYAGNDTAYGMMFNGDTNDRGNYYGHNLAGNGGSAYTQDFDSSLIAWTIANSSRASGIFTATIVDILDYANTNKYTTSRSLSGFDANGAGVVGLSSSMWKNTAAVTSIRFDARVLGSTSDFAADSHFALYGIKDA